MTAATKPMAFQREPATARSPHFAELAVPDKGYISVQADLHQLRLWAVSSGGDLTGASTIYLPAAVARLVAAELLAAADAMDQATSAATTTAGA